MSPRRAKGNRFTFTCLTRARNKRRTTIGDVSDTLYKLKTTDVRRILSFCVPGSQVDLIEARDGRVIRIFAPGPGGIRKKRFIGVTYEAALRAAAEAGAVRSACIERQIAFMAIQAAPPSAAPLANGHAPPPSRTVRLTLAHYRGLAEFRYRIRRFVSFSEQAARATGLEPSQHQLMLAVRGLPPPKQPDLATLAERMCMDIGVCEAVVASLVHRNLLSLSAEEEPLVSLTGPGKTLLRELTVLHREQILLLGPTFVQTLGTVLSEFEDMAEE